jgi:hypoxanthine phosphoribosyltransferase
MAPPPQGHRILIVDEVDDTRKTLAYAVEELMKDIAAERADFLAAATSSKAPPAGPVTPGGLANAQDGSQQTMDGAAAAAALAAASEQEVAAAAAAAGWQEPQLGVFVVHNKLKPKLRELPEWLMSSAYFAAAHIPDQWVSNMPRAATAPQGEEGGAGRL